MTKMGHTEMTIVGISNKRKIGRLYKVHQLLPILNKKIRQTGIPNWKYKSLCTHHPTSTLISKKG